jgi:hypothetical protein
VLNLQLVLNNSIKLDQPTNNQIKRSNNMKYTFPKKHFWFGLSSLLILVSLVFVLQSCYPGDDITAADTDIVATYFDKEADFSTKLTFSMPDKVFRLDDEGNPIEDPGANDQLALNRIKSNLVEAGFSEITDPDTSNPSTTPDVLVIAFANQSTWVSGGCYSSWYSYYYPYYGWCYPVYYTYDIGTILIAMVDPNESRNALWVAALNGILEDTNAGIADRLTDGIDQAFTQSPYLYK